MIPSVQSPSATSSVLPIQTGAVPKAGGFKQVLDQASETQDKATPDTRCQQAPEGTAQQTKGDPKSINDDHRGKAKEEKADQNSVNVLASDLVSPLQILPVQVPVPVAPPANEVQPDATPAPSASTEVQAATPGPVSIEANEVPVPAAGVVPTTAASAISVPKQQRPDAAPGATLPEAAPLRPQQSPDNQSVRAKDPTKPELPAADDPVTTPNTKVSTAARKFDEPGAFKAAVAASSKVPAEVPAELRNAKTAPAAQQPTASDPVQNSERDQRVNKESPENLPIIPQGPEVPNASVAKDITAQAIETAQQVPSPSARPVAQESRQDVSQPTKSAKPHTVQQQGQSVAGRNEPVGNQQVSPAQTDNKNDNSSSAKSFSQETEKAEVKKSESGFDPQAGALAAARQNVNREPAGDVRAESQSHAAAQNTPVPASRQFQAATPNISSAQLVQTMNGSEMRVGLHSVEFGNIAIHTAIDHGNVSANISVEHSSLGKAMADQLPALQAKLHDEQGIRTQINIQQQSAGFSGEARQQQQSQEYQQSRLSNAEKALFQHEGATSSVSVPTNAVETANGRLSIRI